MTPLAQLAIAIGLCVAFAALCAWLLLRGEG